MERGPQHLPKALALISPLIFAVLLGWVGTTFQPYAQRWDVYLRPVAVDDAAELERMLADLDYFWPLRRGMSVPRIAVDPLPDDFGGIRDVDRKKSLFFRALLPIVLAEDERVRRQRGFVLAAYDAGMPAPDSAEWRILASLMKEYEVKGKPDTETARRTLLRRVDTVPTALVLAQAANESAWGASRFARLGNNLFGEWTYDADKGIVPAARKEGRTHAVRRFRSVRSSVRSYVHNINVGHAYRGLREMRARMRRDREPLDPFKLAGGLERYSARGKAYVEELRAMIRGNDLTVLRGVELSPSAPAVFARLPTDESTGG